MKRLIAIATLVGVITFGASSCGLPCNGSGGNPNDGCRMDTGIGAPHHHHAILTSAQR